MSIDTSAAGIDRKAHDDAIVHAIIMQVTPQFIAAFNHHTVSHAFNHNYIVSASLAELVFQGAGNFVRQDKDQTSALMNATNNLIAITSEMCKAAGMRTASIRTVNADGTTGPTRTVGAAGNA